MKKLVTIFAAVVFLIGTSLNASTQSVEKLNLYQDAFIPTANGCGVDISSQRQDELDLKCFAIIEKKILETGKCSVIDLGGGNGTYSMAMARLGASVIMIDIEEMSQENLNLASNENLKFRFIQKDFNELTNSDIPNNFDILYSQRAIHYIPYEEAKKLLKTLFAQIDHGGFLFLSANGWDTEYGKTYPDREKPVEKRFNYLTPKMQKKHGIYHKVVTYKKEEMAALLESCGFKEISVTSSLFGNIKATAKKP